MKKKMLVTLGSAILKKLLHIYRTKQVVWKYLLDQNKNKNKTIKQQQPQSASTGVAKSRALSMVEDRLSVLALTFMDYMISATYTSPSISFSLCKMGIVMIPPSCGFCKDCCI